ncbi:hypothetical protein ILYODFUR_029847 [Ilyodon furcidens]|uniref:Uncharacterized protein n=1 Tax=Ilyodon furcidens TaxID=33524 RepID=A0ABV0TCH1_9TELE
MVPHLQLVRSNQQEHKEELETRDCPSLVCRDPPGNPEETCSLCLDITSWILLYARSLAVAPLLLLTYLPVYSHDLCCLLLLKNNNSDSMLSHHLTQPPVSLNF